MCVRDMHWYSQGYILLTRDGIFKGMVLEQSVYQYSVKGTPAPKIYRCIFLYYVGYVSSLFIFLDWGVGGWLQSTPSFFWSFGIILIL